MAGEEVPLRPRRFANFGLTMKSLGFGFGMTTLLFFIVMGVNGKPEKVNLDRLEQFHKEFAEERERLEAEEEKKTTKK